MSEEDDAYKAGEFAGSVAMDLMELFHPSLMQELRDRIEERAKEEEERDGSTDGGVA